MPIRRIFSRPHIEEVSPEQAQQRQGAGALIVDVREPDEWAEGHVPGALHLPLGQLVQRLGELDPSQELIMVCRSGNRSAAATAALQQAGYSRVSNLAGGMVAWSRKGLPVRHE